MKQLVKWITALVSLGVLALVVVLVTVTSFVTPEQAKPYIISEFKRFTGFEMTIPSSLSWSFYPNLGMEAKEVTVNDPSVFSSKLNNLVLQVRFDSLLHKRLDFSKASIGELQLNQLQATNVQTKIKFKDQVLSLEDLTADLYQGELNATTTLSLKQASPDLHIVGKLTKVDIAGLLQGLSGKTSKLQFNGHADLSWDVTTQGKKTEELLKQLNGSGRFAVDKGSMKGIDLAFFVNTATALINKEPLPTSTSSGVTEFGQLRGTAVIKDGVLTTNDLTLDSPLYAAKATGSLDLVNQTLDYHVEVSSKVQTKQVLALYGKTVPIRVSGSISDPSVTLDTLALMKEVGKEQLQRVGEEIQKALPDKANNIIKNLFH